MTEKTTFDITAAERSILCTLRDDPKRFLTGKSCHQLTCFIRGYASALTVRGISPESHNIFPFTDIPEYDPEKDISFGVDVGKRGWFSYFEYRVSDNEELFDSFFQCLDEELINDGYMPLARDGEHYRDIPRTSVCDISERERVLLKGMKMHRFLFFVGHGFDYFCAWTAGYSTALDVIGADPAQNCLIPAEGFNSFVAEKYHTSGGWSDIIRAAEPDDSKALDLFFSLLNEYLLGHGYKAIGGAIPLPPADNEPVDITPDERRILAGLKKRPAMYLGRKSLRSFDIWLNGYQIALRMTGIPQTVRNILPDGEVSIHDFAAEKYLGKGKESTCGWINCILSHEPDDTKALDVCFEFLDEYLCYLGFEPLSQTDGEQN